MAAMILTNIAITLAVAMPISSGAAGYDPAALAEMEQTLHQLNSNMTRTLAEIEGKNSSKSHPNEERAQLELAFCIIDSIQAAIALGQAGTGIAEAVHVCKPVNLPDGSIGVPKDLQDDCAEAITFVLASFGHVGTFLSAATSQCATSLNLQAYCAANVLDIFTQAAVLAEAGSGMSNNCVPVTGTTKPISVFSNFQGRRLTEPVGQGAVASVVSNSPAHAVLPGNAGEHAEDAAHDAAHLEEVRQVNVALCVFDVLQATGFLARAGAIIAETVEVCHEFEQLKAIQKEQATLTESVDEAEAPVTPAPTKPTPKTKELATTIDDSIFSREADLILQSMSGSEDPGRRLKIVVRVNTTEVKHAERRCAVNILHTIASFSYVASFLSFAGAHCPETKNLQAACAGSIINVITALSATSAAAIDMENSCALIGKNNTNSYPEEENAITRRLFARASTDEGLVFV